MYNVRMLFAVTAMSLITGCASGLNSYQKAELDHYEAKGLVIEEKSPGAGAALGLLPGGGSFYGRSYGIGVVNLLFWPVSILWDPVSGYDAATAINYHATKVHVDDLKSKAMDDLDTQLAGGEIDLTQYTLKKRKVDDKYKYN